MRRQDEISLDFLTALELDPPSFVSLAAAHGLRRVNLMVQPMMGFPYFHLLGDTGTRRRARERCEAEGVRVDMVEPFFIDRDTDPLDFRPGFETGAYLGAQCVNLIARDADMSRLGDRMARTAELAAEYRLGTVTEISKRGSLSTVPQTAAFLDALGDDRIRIEVDALHFFRLQGDVADLVRHADRIGRAQLCDGPATPPEDEWMEARDHRLPPGEGGFPLQQFIDALPPGIVIGIEVPNRAYPLDERVRRSVAGTRRLMGLAG